jgi:hypothetical protein
MLPNQGLVPRKDAKRLEDLYRVWTQGMKVVDLWMSPLNRPSLGSWMGYLLMPTIRPSVLGT